VDTSAGAGPEATASRGAPPAAAPEATTTATPAPSPRGSRAAAPVLAWFDRARLRLLRRAVPPPAHLVDAGAGRGRFVAAARSAGYDAEGFELDPGRAAAAASAYGVSLRAEGIETAAYDPEIGRASCRERV